MAGFIEADTTELRQLEADLSGAPFRVQRAASRSTRQAAQVVDTAMRDDAKDAQQRKPSHIKHLHRAVSHEMLEPLMAEVGLGPGRPGGQGSLAHIIAYGSVNNAPVYDHTAGLRRSMPVILDLYADAAEDSVLGDD